MTSSKSTSINSGLIESFERYAQAAGAHVSFVPDQAEAGALIVDSTDVGITIAGAVRQRYPALAQALDNAGRQVAVAEDLADAHPAPSDLAIALSGGTGIVLALARLAETGSVTVADDALAPRLLSMLADVCVVLLPGSAIVPGLDEAAGILAELNRIGHRYVSLVTGPSRTADIERVLTIGVQGPKALHIIVIGEDGS